MGRVESLLVVRPAVDHTQCRNVVDYFPLLGIVEIASAVIPSVTVCVRVCGCVCVLC